MGCGITPKATSASVINSIVKSSPPDNANLKRNYISLSVLGCGAFSEVMRCLHRPDNSYRALKIIRKRVFRNDPLVLQMILKEPSLLRSYQHPNILAAYEPYEDDSCFYIPLELCEGGTLSAQPSQTQKAFAEADAAEIMSQLFSALAYVHAKNVVHRDIKAENILIKKKGELEIRLADFGFACEKDEDGMVQGNLGTLQYKAPEVRDGSYTEKADIWSCGILLFILLTAELPYQGKDQKEIKRLIKHEPFSIRRSKAVFQSEELMDLFDKLLRVRPSKRISAEDALQHPWIVHYQNLRRTDPSS